MTKRTLLATDRVMVAVCRYEPNEQHRPHTDRHSRISLLLRGSYHEEARPGAIQMRPGDVLLKSDRATHGDHFGERGADLVSIEFLQDDPFGASNAPDFWRQRRDGFALRHASAYLEAALGSDPSMAEAAGHDLIAATVCEDRNKRQPPAWVKRLRQELEDLPLAKVSVAERACAAGAHPVQASRLFRRCFGVSITEHAHSQSIRRAIEPLACPEIPLSEVALNAGFYDQSHMTRIFRRVLGRTPGAQRALMSAAG